jgi:hypothetical protein
MTSIFISIVVGMQKNDKSIYLLFDSIVEMCAKIINNKTSKNYKNDLKQL